MLVSKPCLTLCNPIDCGQPGSSVYGIFQPRILEWVAIPFFRGSSWPRDWTYVSSIAGGFFTANRSKCNFNYISKIFFALCCCSVTKLCLTLCNPMDCSMPGFPVLYHLPELVQTHVHWVSDATNHLILCCPLLLLSIFPSNRAFANESVLRIRWPKYWSFSFSITPSNEYSGLISFRVDRLDLLAVQGTLNSLLQHHSSKASILQCSALFIVQLSHPYMTTGKTTALTRQTFVGKVMSLLFNMLSRLVITFLPRSRRLLISWLQSPSAVILEPPKIKSDSFHCFPIYFPWSDGTRFHDLRFLNVEF